jgi:hypothetical protein
MKIPAKTMSELRALGATLPEYSSIELCLPGEGGKRVCHRFGVVGGVLHHHESHSADFVTAGKGPLEEG